jgi:hypothetical protein
MQAGSTNFPPVMTFLGPSRGIGAGSLQPENAHMRVAPVRLIRQRRYATDSANTRLSRQARDTLDCRGWHQSLGRNLRGECGGCACACCGEFDVLEDCCRRSILHPEQRADTLSRFHSRSLEEFWTRMWQAPFFYTLCLSNSYMVLTLYFCDPELLGTYRHDQQINAHSFRYRHSSSIFPRISLGSWAYWQNGKLSSWAHQPHLAAEA